MDKYSIPIAAVDSVRANDIVFTDSCAEPLGKLTMNDGVMRFEGNAEESAKFFFEHVCKQMLTDEVKELRKRIDELETFIEEIDHQYDAMQQIKSWCQAYPHDIFPEPDWVEVREKLGDRLLSRVSAANMRHVTQGIINIITECEKNHTDR